MTHVHVVSPAAIVEPRGAVWAARLVVQLRDLFQSAGTYVKAHQEVRGRAGEASAVRRLADAMRDQDPRFAADLYAAADRHELS